MIKIKSYAYWFKYFILTIVSFLAGSQYADASDFRDSLYTYSTQMLGEKEGLYNLNIYGLVIDNKGVVWGGNRDGLFIYDGKNVTRASLFFKQDKNSYLLDNEIIFLFYSKKEQILYIGSKLYDGTIIYSLNLNVDHEKYHYLKIVSYVPERVISSSYYMFVNNSFFCLSSDKLYIIHVKEGTAYKQKTINVGQKKRMFVDDKNGICLLDEVNFKLIKYNNLLETVSTGSKDILTKESYKFFIKEGWAKSLNGVIYTNKPQSDLLRKIDSFIIAGLPEIYRSAYGIVCASENVFYIYGQFGICKLSRTKGIPFSGFFTKHENRSIFYNAAKKAGYVATADGIYKFTFNKYNFPEGRYHSRVLNTIGYHCAIVKMNDSICFFYPAQSGDSITAINIFSGETKKLKNFFDKPLFCALRKKNGEVFLGSNNGFFKSVNGFAPTSKDGFVYDKTFGTLNDIKEFDTRNFIIASNSGLFLVNQLTYEKKILVQGDFLTVTSFNNGWLAGTLSNGLIILNNKGEIQKSLTKNDGLANNAVYSIVYDDRYKTAWLGTAKGLSIYNLRFNTFKTLDDNNNHGLINKEFNRTSTFFSMKDSLLIMGGTDGLSFINDRFFFPALIQLNTGNIWSVSVSYNNSIRYFFRGFASQNNRINLEPDVKDITIKTSMVSGYYDVYALAYKVNNSNWQYADPAKDIVLNGLDAGVHKINIRIESALGETSDVQTVTFNIAEHWYKQKLAFVFYLGLIIYLVYLIIKWREHYIRLSAANELNKSKEKLFSIIAHDLRSPLKAYQGLTESLIYLMKKNDYAAVEEISKEIDGIGQNLDLLMNNLLNWSLMQQKELKPIYTPINLAASVNEIIPLYLFLAKSKNIELKYLANFQPTQEVVTDKNIFLLILRNLLDNAIKYTPDEGFCSLSITITENKLVVVTENELKSSNVQNLHNLIKSITDNEPNTGSGLGMKFIYQSVSELKGELVIKVLNADSLAQFKIILPFK